MRITNKKGALSLAINSIVVIVIAFVILGLGLQFVRTQLSSAGEATSAVQEQIKQQILDELRTGNKPLSFPATTLKVETGDDSVQAIGIKNTDDEDKTLLLTFQVKTNTGFINFESEKSLTFTTTSGVETDATISWDDSDHILGAGDVEVVPVTITAPDKNGNYLHKIILTEKETGEIFSTKTFFVKTN